MKEEKPEAITKRALSEAKKGGYDVLLLDTAGRLHIDGELMAELQAVKKLSNPTETLLVAARISRNLCVGSKLDLVVADGTKDLIKYVSVQISSYSARKRITELSFECYFSFYAFIYFCKMPFY